ncbi:MAG: 3-keto-disaccharide hydrolase [Candidatus Saccharimonadaceae bacterium]
MKTISSILLTFVAFSSIVLVSCNTKNKTIDDSSEWIQLLAEDNLDDWTVKITGYEVGENYANTFHMEDGILKVRYDEEAYPTFENRFGHMFYKDTFSHYVLRLEYRFVGHQCPGAPGWAFRNSGVMIHGQSPESMVLDQDFPVSIEVQLLGSDSTRQQVTGSVCTPGTNIVINGELILDHCIQSSSTYYMDDQWVTAEIEVKGNEIIKHIINGDTVMVYNKPQLDEREQYYTRMLELNKGEKMLSSGTISLQSEGHPCDFRNVEIKVLKD